MKQIGLTTTVPIEVLLAAGYQPVDLNNIFITSDDYGKYIEIAERDGFPKSLCAWIKGIYGVCMTKGIQEIVGVMEGDCSNTKTLIEVLASKGIKVYSFSYPHSRQLEAVKAEIDKFMNLFGVQREEVENMRLRLNRIRSLGKEIDRLACEEWKATGFENHLIQVSFSDCNGDIEDFEKDLTMKVDEVRLRKPDKKELRLGYMGVPPMTGDLYDFVEGFHGRILYNEVQREFAFPRADKACSIYEQYRDYTYPYDIHFRLHEVKRQIKERRLDGIIHYTQAFCYRAVEDILIKQELDIPILHIEGDKVNCLDARTKLRLEAFLDMLRDRKEIFQ
ncbi:MAG: 2-hydroxyacyl-CoA dehydratase family protein [Bacillota bacterium]